MSISPDDIFQIKEKKVSNIATKKGIIQKVIYRFYVNDIKQQRCAICITTQNNISRITSSLVDKDSNLLDINMVLSPKELIKFNRTMEWAMLDFKKSHQEIKKYIIR